MLSKCVFYHLYSCGKQATRLTLQTERRLTTTVLFHGLLPMWPSHDEPPAPKLLLNMGRNTSSLLVYWTDTSGHCFLISLFFMVTSADSALCADRPPGSLEAAGWQENKTQQREKKMFLRLGG